MRHRSLGKTAITLPVIGLGTWATFDTEISRVGLVSEAFAAGVNLFDTSPMYGRSERSLSEALGEKREQAIIATKVAARSEAEGLSQVETSLRLFEYIDLYQIHNIIEWRTQLPMLERLKDEGKIRAIGATLGLHVSHDEFVEVLKTGRIDAIQIRYNPCARAVEEQILPLAEKLDIGVLVMQPLRWGVLRAEPSTEELLELDVETWPEAVMRWIVADPRVTSVLMATQTAGRIAANARAGTGSDFSGDQRRLVEGIIRRGRSVSSGPSDGSVTSATLEMAAHFLAEKKGASFCENCLSEALVISASAAREVQRQLSDDFVTEDAPCLQCGRASTVVRARTMIR